MPKVPPKYAGFVDRDWSKYEAFEAEERARLLPKLTIEQSYRDFLWLLSLCPDRQRTPEEQQGHLDRVAARQAVFLKMPTHDA